MQLPEYKNMQKARWLLYLDQTNHTLGELFSDTNIPFDCEFLVAHKEGSQTFAITELYRVSPSLPLRTHKLSSLSELMHGYIKRRSSLQGLVFQSAVLNAVSVWGWVTRVEYV